MRFWILLLVLPLLLTTPCAAMEIQKQQADLLQTDELTDVLPDDAKELLPDVDPADMKNPKELFISLLKKALNKAFPSIKSALKTGFTVLIILLLCQTFLSFSASTSHNAVILCGVATILITIAGPFGNIVADGVSAICELGTFAKTLMPVMGGALAASGAPISSSAVCALTLLAINGMILLVEKLLIPAVYFFVAMGAAQATLGDTSLSKIQKMLGSVIKNTLRTVLFLFSALLSITGVLSGKADAMTLKATKMAVSSVVPVVGGMISDASETVLVGAGLLLNSVGLFGMLAILAIIILPFLHLGSQYFILQGVAALGGIIGCKEHNTLIDTISAAAGYLFAATCTCGIMCFVACICFMKVSVI